MLWTNISANNPLINLFQYEYSQKERYNEKRYKFYFFFLFGNFLKNNERENNFFFKKGRGYRALQLIYIYYRYPIPDIKG
jgi:hypothetical protein